MRLLPAVTPSFLLVLACAGPAASAPLPAVPSDVLPPSACSAASRHPAAEPPAWLLLAGAVVLLGAGRLAAS